MGTWLTTDEFEAIAEALRQARGLDASTTLTRLGEGFGSVALESSDGDVILVAKNEMGASSLRLSVALLPELGPTLPATTPQPLWSIERASGLLLGAWAYRKLPGRLMTQADADGATASLVQDVGRFMARLHSFPVDQASKLGVLSLEGLWHDLRRLRAHVEPALRERLSPYEYRQVASWWDGFLDVEAFPGVTAVVTHGDLFPQNLLVNDDAMRLLGVIDWGDTCIADSAYDFAPLQVCGAGFVDACLVAYRAEGGERSEPFARRVQLYWELRAGSFYSLRASMREGDEGEIAQAIADLRVSPSLA